MIFVVTGTFLGLLFLFFEFFLPGGVVGVIGGLFIIASLFLMIFLIQAEPLFLTLYIFFLLLSIFCTVKLALTIVKRKSEKNFFCLHKNQEGFVASFHQKELYGKIAIAASDLKPSGYIAVDGEYYQAVSDSSYIKKNEKVLIEGGEGSRLIVRKLN